MIRTYFALSLLASCAFARQPLTVVAQFEHTYSDSAVKEMQKELQSLMVNSGVELDWRLLSELGPSESFPDLVVVKFHGACDANAPSRRWSGTPAALAYTHVSDGQVLPFSEVDCDEVRSFVSAKSDLEFGRALGRVMAHELHHILTRSQTHPREGVARRSLSSTELTARRFR